MLAQASREDILYKYKYAVYCLLEFLINVNPHQSYFYVLLHIKFIK